MEYLRALNLKGGVQGIDLGLRRIASIARQLELFSPQEHIPKYIHVAGTNGKGSVCAKLEAALYGRYGQHTGCFTSPHVETVRERFRVNGRMISYAELSGLAEELRVKVEAAGEEEPTYFEALTLVSFMLFKSRRVDVGIIETGLGGLTDATNIIPRPQVCCITSIGLEHQRFLGEDLRAIAMHKAGIIKPGATVVIGPGAKPVDVFEKAAESNGCELIRVRAEGEETVNEENTAIAEAVLKAIDTSWTAPLKDIHAPCRFEEHQLDKTRVVIDAAHNPHAFRRLAKDLVARFADLPMTFVLAFSVEKSPLECVTALLDTQGLNVRAIIFAQSANQGRAMDAQALLKECEEIETCTKFSTVHSLAQTLDEVIHDPSQEVLVASGTIFFLNDVKIALGVSAEESTEGDGFDSNEQKL